MWTTFQPLFNPSFQPSFHPSEIFNITSWHYCDNESHANEFYNLCVINFPCSKTTLSKLTSNKYGVQVVTRILIDNNTKKEANEFGFPSSETYQQHEKFKKIYEELENY